MTRAELYTWTFCPYCMRAKQVLDEHGVAYTEHVMDDQPAELRALKARYEHSTVPIILLDGAFIGGCDELEALAAAGKLAGDSPAST